MKSDTQAQLERLCAAGAQVAAIQMAADKNPALSLLAAQLGEELLAIHDGVLEGDDDFRATVTRQRTQRTQRQADAQQRHAARVRERMKTEGPALWAEWHRRALNYNGDDDSAFIKALALRLPCGECRRDFLAMVATETPKFSRAGSNYFALTVEIHNRVNAKLGKPVMTVEAARALWSAPATP